MATYRSFGLIISALFGMLFMISTQALPVLSTPLFFRTNVINPDGSAADRLLIGTVVNPAQGTSAVATQGATTVVLQNTGYPNELSANLPYNPAQLGPWTITITNGLDVRADLTHDLFGVQALPFVSNITVSGSLLAPTLTWELPVTSVPYTRIRMRVTDFAGGALVFNSDPLPMNATTYTLPNGVLQPDRDYALHVMLEEMRDGVVVNGEVRNGVLINRSDRRICYNTYSTPLTISHPDVYYFRRAVRSTGATDRDEILLDAIKVTPSACTTVAARSLVDNNVNGPMNFVGGGIFPNEFAAIFPFNSVSVDVATGGFTITANNGGAQDQMTTHNIVGVQPLAFVENVNITGNPLAPTVSWALPAATAPFTRISVRVLELDANYSIIFNFGSPDLAATTTTYTIPDGVLKPNSDYSIRIRLQDVRDGVLINSSEVRVPYSTASTLSAFSVNPLRINQRLKTFFLLSTFTLGTDSNGIDPVAEAVTLRVADFVATIPAGSFRQGSGPVGAYAFAGKINQVAIEALIVPLGNNRFRFQAAAYRADLTGTTNPVPVELTIGDDSGAITVTNAVIR